MTNTVPQGAAMLLEFIREAEVGSSGRASYDVIYGHNQGGLAKPLTAMTVAQVLAERRDGPKRMVRALRALISSCGPLWQGS